MLNLKWNKILFKILNTHSKLGLTLKTAIMVLSTVDFLTSYFYGGLQCGLQHRVYHSTQGPLFSAADCPLHLHQPAAHAWKFRCKVSWSKRHQKDKLSMKAEVCCGVNKSDFQLGDEFNRAPDPACKPESGQPCSRALRLKHMLALVQEGDMRTQVASVKTYPQPEKVNV